MQAAACGGLGVGSVCPPVKTFTFDALPLRQGGTFGPVTLAYETWGRLNAAGDNAVLITHALTGNTHAHDAERPDDTKIAWWNPLIGPGRFFDTSRYFVICSNILGGCYGSTGPSSLNPQHGASIRNALSRHHHPGYGAGAATG